MAFHVLEDGSIFLKNSGLINHKYLSSTLNLLIKDCNSNNFRQRLTKTHLSLRSLTHSNWIVSCSAAENILTISCDRDISLLVISRIKIKQSIKQDALIVVIDFTLSFQRIR